MDDVVGTASLPHTTPTQQGQIQLPKSKLAETAVLHDKSVGTDTKLDIYINYPKFNTSLVHDPEFGTTWEAVGYSAGPATTFFFQLLEETVKEGFAGIMVIMTAGFGSVFLYQRRKQR